MADIFHYFPIHASGSKVFDAIASPYGLDQWWAKETTGKPAMGEIFQLFFEPNYRWTAVVSKYTFNQAFELTMQISDKDWEGSKVGFRLLEQNSVTDVQFYHTGWKEDNAHFRISNFCWAMYLRLLKRYVEYEEIVPYALRLEV